MFTRLIILITSILVFVVYNEYQTSQEIEQESLQIVKTRISEHSTRLAKAKLAKEKEERCLAKNIYHEAGVESKKGKILVGQVTLNRLKTKRWGTSVCDVVYSKAQFSWTLNPNKIEEVPDGPLWRESAYVAKRVLTGELRLPEYSTALFYHTDYIDLPSWADVSAKLGQVGRHIVYYKALTKEETQHSS